MLLAALAAVAALLTFISFMAPGLFGSALALAIAAAALRLATVWFLRPVVLPAGEDGRRGTIALLVGETLFLVATALSIPVEPHMEAAGIGGWISLGLWIIYGAACAYGGIKLIAMPGWVRFGGILVAAAAGFWFTQIGLLVWPFAMAAGYACFAMAGLRPVQTEAT